MNIASFAKVFHDFYFQILNKDRYYLRLNDVNNDFSFEITIYLVFDILGIFDYRS